MSLLPYLSSHPSLVSAMPPNIYATAQAIGKMVEEMTPTTNRHFGEAAEAFLPRNPGMKEWESAAHSWSDLKALGFRWQETDATPDQHWYIFLNKVELPLGWKVRGDTHKRMLPNNLFAIPSTAPTSVTQFFPRSIIDEHGFQRVEIDLHARAFDKDNGPLSVVNGDWRILTRYGVRTKFSYPNELVDPKWEWEEVFDRTIKEPLYVTEHSAVIQAGKGQSTLVAPYKPESGSSWLNREFPQWQDWRAYW